MKEKDRKQPWLPARTSWEDILHHPTIAPFLLPLLSSLSFSSPAAVRQGGYEQLLTRREREDGNAREMGVVLNGMEVTALHPVKREYDTQQSDKAYFPSVPAESVMYMCKLK